METTSVRHDDEVTRWSGQPSWSQYFFLWFITAVFGLRVGLFVWWGEWGSAAIHVAGMAVFVSLAVFFRRTTRYTLTQEAVYRTTGLLGQRENRLPLSEFESVSVGLTRLDQLLGIGTVLLNRADGTSERLAGLSEPEVIQRKIEALLRKSRASS
jgi:membrane protein YdbS with pleckstrin-like domain